MKITENITLTAEEIKTAEKFHELLEKNIKAYVGWYRRNSDEEGLNDYWMKDELKTAVLDFAKEISAEAAANTFGYYGMSVLHQLVTHNYYEAVKILLEKGVNPDIRGVRGTGDYEESYIGVTPLHTACLNGNLNMYKLLVEYGADSTLVDEHNRNGFHFLAEGGRWYMIHDRSFDSDYFNLQLVEIAKLLQCDINQADTDNRTPLYYALWKTAHVTPRFLCPYYIERGADVFIKDDLGNTTLTYATDKMYVRTAYALMQNKELINACDKDGNTPLHIAFRCRCKRYIDIAYLLFRHGARDDIKNHAGITAKEYLSTEADEEVQQTYTKYFKRNLSVAKLCDLISGRSCYWSVYHDENFFMDYVVKEILQKLDFDDDIELEYVGERFEYAYNFIYAHALKLFASRGFDLCKPFYVGSRKTCLRDIGLKAAYYQPEIMETLSEMKIDLNEAIIDNRTPAYIIMEDFCKTSKAKERYIDDYECHPLEGVITALKYVSAESMTELCDEGASALHLTARDVRDDYIINYMIKRGVDVNITTSTAGNTPLHFACSVNNVEAVRALMAAGADDSIMNDDGETPAHTVFVGKDRQKIYQILKMLNNVNIPCGRYGRTPFQLMLAKWDNNQDCIDFFLDKGVDINRADMEGNTPLLTYSQRFHDRDVVKLLLSEGADINARNSSGNSLLLYVLKRVDSALACYLIKKGADYNIVNEKGETPASIALENNFESVLELMTDITVLSSDEAKSNRDYGACDDDDEEDYYYEDDEEDDEDDYYDEDEDEDDEEPYKGSQREIDDTVQAYCQIFGQQKGRRIAELVLRMGTLQEMGLEDETNMAEYTALAEELQRVREGK